MISLGLRLVGYAPLLGHLTPDACIVWRRAIPKCRACTIVLLPELLPPTRTFRFATSKPAFETLLNRCTRTDLSFIPPTYHAARPAGSFNQLDCSKRRR